MALWGIQLTGGLSMVNRPPGDRHRVKSSVFLTLQSTVILITKLFYLRFTVSIWLNKFKMEVVNSDQAEPTSTELKPITVENLEVDFLPIIYDIIRRYVCCFIELLQY